MYDIISFAYDAIQVSNSVPTKSMTINTCMRSGRTRVSKRVMPSCEQDQVARVTRQRTRELSSTKDDTTTNPQDSAIEDMSVAANSPTHTQSDDQILMSDEGKCSSHFLKQITSFLFILIMAIIIVGIISLNILTD